MGWLQLVGLIKLYVSFAKETYKRNDILQKRPIILSILLTVATPYEWITYERMTSRIEMSHVTCVNESCHTYKWMTYEQMTSRIEMSHVTQTASGSLSLRVLVLEMPRALFQPHFSVLSTCHITQNCAVTVWCVCDVTRSCVWRIHMCDMTQIICVTWCIYACNMLEIPRAQFQPRFSVLSTCQVDQMYTVTLWCACDVTRSYARRIHMCDVTQFIFVTWLVYMCGALEMSRAIFPPCFHVLSTCRITRNCAVTLRCVCDVTRTHVRRIHLCDVTQFICVAWLVRMRRCAGDASNSIPATFWVLSTCHITQICTVTLWCDSFVRVTWLIRVHDMTHPYVWRAVHTYPEHYSSHVSACLTPTPNCTGTLWCVRDVTRSYMW